MGISTHLKIFFGEPLIRDSSDNTIYGRLSRLRKHMLFLPMHYYRSVGKRFEYYEIFVKNRGFVLRAINPDVSNSMESIIARIVSFCIAIFLAFKSIRIPWTSITLPPLGILLWTGGLILKIVDPEYWKYHRMVVDYLINKEKLAEKVAGYLKEDSDFVPVKIDSFRFDVPIWKSISKDLQPTDVVHLSKSCKALHRITKEMWGPQREKLRLDLKMNVSEKRIVKEEFCKVHRKCPESLIKIFGVERILLMKPSSLAEYFGLNTYPTAAPLSGNCPIEGRSEDFQQFAFICYDEKSKLNGVLLVGYQGTVDFGTQERCFPILMQFLDYKHFPAYEIQYEAAIPNLEKFVKEGSAEFTSITGSKSFLLKRL